MLSKGYQPSRWRKSSFSGDGDCLEWLIDSDGVRLRDSDNPSGAELYLSHAAWIAFLAGIKSGEADLPPR